ncbi:MAG: PKD domain-containing protein [Methanolinea sp.]|nr:PKD domain-containing protein [Methanolinea sp.]
MTSGRGLQIVIAMLMLFLCVLPVAAALGITGINPPVGLNTEELFIANVSGTDFPGQAEVSVLLNRTGEADIAAKSVVVSTPSWIICIFDLREQKAGPWNVVVVNTTSGQTAVLEGGFQIENPAPTVTSITPDSGENAGWSEITEISGSNFLPNVAVNLTRGTTVIPGANVTRASPTKITCLFNLTSAETGLYNVTVTNEDGKSATLANGFRVRYPVPVVTSIQPASGKNNEVIGITNLSGSGFMQGVNVTLRRTGHADIPTINGAIVESPRKILCFFDLNGAHVGQWDVVVVNPDGQNGTLPAGFTIYYPDAPAVTGITPGTGPNTGLVYANVTGSGFQENATIVLTRGPVVVPGTVLSTAGTTLGVRFNLTGVPAGTYDLTVTNEDGQGSTKANAFTVTNPPPTVSAVDPESGLNDGHVTIDVYGTGFLPGAYVSLWRGAVSFGDNGTVFNSTHLRLTVSLIGKQAGLYNVTVTNTDGLSGTKADAFTILNPAPRVISVVPATGENTGPISDVLVTGEKFLPGANVTLRRTNETPVRADPATWVNSTAIRCTFDLTGMTAGIWTLEVENPDGRTSTEHVTFTVTNPPPNPQAIVPDSGLNNGSILITGLTGSGFLPGASVKLSRAGVGDIQSTWVDVNATTQTIMCVFNLNGARVGYWDVVVTNTDGQSGSLPNGFFVRYPAAPSVSAIEPAFAPNTGPVAITNLSGSGFQSNATVKLVRTGHTDIVATAVNVVDQGRITCTLNLSGANPGTWDVEVTNEDGQSGTLQNGFEVRYPAPAVTGIEPNKGNNNQVVAITNLSGSNFRSGATARLVRAGHSDIVAAGVNVVNSGKITCSFNLTGREVGNWDVVVTNTDGQSGTLANGFTIEYPAPVVSSVQPSKGANDGLVEITAITGNYFREGATVTLTRTGVAPIQATNVTVINATAINCTVNLLGKTVGLWNVIVTNPDGKSGQLTNGFQILPPPPVPDFTASPVYGTVPLTVQFTDLSTNNPTAWIWDFGDGTQSGVLDRNPVHTYNAMGTYNVTLTVFNQGAPEGRSTTKSGYITVVRTPVADFTATPTSGNAPLLVQFTDTSMGNPTGWTWNFGDGSISTQQNPYHLYTKPGTYNVTLAVRNSAGSNSVTKTGYITVRALPVADFSANRTSGAAPLVVKFTDQSTGGPTAWTWTFGDGSESTEQNPVHTYAAPGIYTVKLEVANDAGTSSKTRTGYITVGEGLLAAFTYTTSNPGNYAPLTVAFTDASTGSPSLWTWTFGDGRMTTERNPIHTYTAIGNYTVTLTVSDGFRSNSTSQTIEVKPRLVADFKAEPSRGSAPLRVQLTDQSIGSPNSWRWVIIRDAFNMTVFDPGNAVETYTFNEPGSYDVLLTVSDPYGNSDSILKHDVVHVIPFP